MPPIVQPDAIREFERLLEDVRAEWKGMDPSEISLKAATKAMELMTPEGLAEVMKLFETTTVTKRLRRIAELDVQQLALTVKKDRPAYIALTFLNYTFPELSPQYNTSRNVHGEALQYVRALENAVRCPVRYVTLGPRSEDMVELPTVDHHWLL